MNTRVTLSLITVLSYGALAVAQGETKELKNPKKILQSADKACKKVKTVQFEAAAWWVDPKSGMPKPIGEGTAVLSGWRKGSPHKYRVRGTFRLPGSKDEHEISAGTDGKVYYLLDWKTKKAYTGKSPAIFGNQPLHYSMFMNAFVENRPFKNDLRGVDHRFVRRTNVGDEECYEISVTYRDLKQGSRWFFSTEDHLPRRVDIQMLNGGRVGSSAGMEVTSVVIDPTLEKDVFAFKLPDGFELVPGNAP